LIDRGALGISDEERYLTTFHVLIDLEKGDLESFAKDFVGPWGRPGNNILRMIPMLIQFFLYKSYNLDPYNPDSLIVPMISNVIFSLILLFLFYRIALIIYNGNFTPAFISTVVYALLTNSNFYMRHILPFDTSLIMFFLAIYLVIKPLEADSGCSIKTSIYAGLLAGMGFSIYPGYYFLPAVILILLVFRRPEKRFSRLRLIEYSVFGVSVFSILLFYEVVARLGGMSYYSTLRELAPTITMGSFEEGFTFIAKYLVKVERAAGILILVLTITYFIKSTASMLKRRAFDLSNKLHLMSYAVLIAFLFHASLSVVFHKMVFYGRLLHMYMPFVVMVSISVISEINHLKIRRFSYGMMLAASVVSCIIFSVEFFPLAYPRDVLHEFNINTEYVYPWNNVSETKDECWIFSSPPRMRNEKPAYDYEKLVLVNFCYFDPLGKDFQRYIPSKDKRLIFRGSHYLSFVAYRFEGFSIEERQALKERDYKVSIYQMVE
jgi:hypothetical protein